MSIWGLRASACWTLAALVLGCGGDAFTTAADGGTVETPSPAIDGSSLDGSMADGPTILVDAGAGWCASQGTGHTFCEDFLHGVPDQLVPFAPTGKLAADTKDYYTAPQSMTASVPGLSENESATAFATHDLSNTTGTQITVSSFFKVDASCFTADDSNAASILALDYAEAHYELVVSVLPTSVALIELTTDADGGNMNVLEQSMPFTGMAGVWQNWTLEVNGGLGTKTAALTIGTMPIFTKATLKGASTLTVLQHANAWFGVALKDATNAPSPACAVGVDDILIDVKSVAVAN